MAYHVVARNIATCAAAMAASAQSKAALIGGGDAAAAAASPGASIISALAAPRDRGGSGRRARQRSSGMGAGICGVAKAASGSENSYQAINDDSENGESSSEA
jgi:hypothetical protein